MNSSQEKAKKKELNVIPDGVIGDYPNATVRRFLAEQWKTLDEEQKIVLKATRGKRGIRCYVCGALGYFKENCPNGCLTPRDESAWEDDDPIFMKITKREQKVKEELGQQAKITAAKKAAAAAKAATEAAEATTAAAAATMEAPSITAATSSSSLLMNSSINLNNSSNSSNNNSTSSSFWGKKSLTNTERYERMKKQTKKKQLQQQTTAMTTAAAASTSATAVTGSAAGQQPQQQQQQVALVDTTFHYEKPLDIHAMRTQAMTRKLLLQEEDEACHASSSFYSSAMSGYARNVSELTLHQLLRRLMRLLKEACDETAEKLSASFDTSLLVPPAMKEEKTFYPAALLKELSKEQQDYLLNTSLQKAQREQEKKLHAHRYQGHARPAFMLDELLRLGKKDGKAKDTYALYTRNEQPSSIHGLADWKSVSGQYDYLANSDLSLMKKQAKLDALFHKQAGWIHLQKKSSQFTNDRYEHLLYLLHHAMEEEHARENALFGGLQAKSVKEERRVAAEIWRQRLQSVDELVATLQAYHFMQGSEQADFLVYCLATWKQATSASSPIQPQQSSAADNKKLAADQEVAAGNNTDDNDYEKEQQTAGDKDDDQSSKNKSSSGKKKKNDHVSSKGKGGNNKLLAKRQQMMSGTHVDLISSSTSPYYHDLAYMEGYEKAKQQLYQRSQQRTALITAEQRRAHEANKQQQLEEKRRKLTDTLVISSHQQQQSGSNSSYGDGEEGDDDGQGEESYYSNSKYNHNSTMSSAMSSAMNSGNSSPVIPTAANTSSSSSILQQTSLSYSHSYNSSSSQQKASFSSSVTTLPLPDLAELEQQAGQHTQKVLERDRKLALHFDLTAQNRADTKLVKQRYVHPREKDLRRVKQRQQAFKYAEFGKRIRKGIDEDRADQLPALIPIPQAFDGNSEVISHTAQQIIHTLKKEMVLGVLGYAPQLAVPLYVRNTLVEKEGTSLFGDPTQAELAKDRRYSHYVGRPMVRFNHPDQLEAVGQGQSQEEMLLHKQQQLQQSAGKLPPIRPSSASLPSSPSNHHHRRQHKDKGGKEALRMVPMVMPKKKLLSEYQQQEDTMPSLADLHLIGDPF